MVEGLGQVVVRAQLEPDDAVGVVAARDQHQDGRVRARADPPADLEAVQVGQHDVEEHGLEGPAGEEGEALLRPRGDRHLEAVPGQVLRDHGREMRIVLDHEDAVGHGGGW